MGDSLANFADIGTLEYTGLTDTGQGYSGSSTVQDVQLGSPVILDTSNGPDYYTASYDFMNSVPDPYGAASLSGVSSPPFGSATVSTPYPNSAPPNANTWAGLTALSKLGAGFSQLFSQPQVTHSGAVPMTMTPAGGALQGGGTSSTNTLILLIVVGALIFLLARGE